MSAGPAGGIASTTPREEFIAGLHQAQSALTRMAAQGYIVNQEDRKAKIRRAQKLLNDAGILAMGGDPERRK